ncbi:c-type cytochrome [Algicola sagamiensis]|uniref:c-type cytochrome n=1 Tax=Algicola sagamiensis TaxID=163869 RepID=UPI00035F1684|nr:c-type cytochrome [Algicola sagamiensis]
MNKIVISVTLLLGFIGSAFAFDGDKEAGKAKSTTCVACHSVDGNSAVDMYPKLAGQHQEYLYQQLVSFKLGHTSQGEEGRVDPVMALQVKDLSDKDMMDLAAYFASQKTKAGGTPEDVIAAGEKLYRAGDKERGIPACTACHGPRGNGMGLANFPKISYQHATYVKTQLEKFRDGRRSNDPNGMMRDVAKKLTDEDIRILSQYVGGLH